MNSPIPQIFFVQESLEKMLAVAEKHTSETGGLILGKVCNYGTGRALVITQITGAGPRSIANESGFRPDMAFYRKVRKKYPHLSYLGEWHKHPDGYIHWSKQDLAQTQEILSKESMPEFICPICSIVDLGHSIKKMQVQCFYTNPSLSTFIPLSYNTISEWDMDKIRFQYFAVEQSLVDSLLSSKMPYRILSADVYPESKVAHLFAQPLQGKARAMLVNTARCLELPLFYGLHFVVTVCPKPKKPPIIRTHCLLQDSDQSYEIKTEVISTDGDIFSRNRALLETSLLKDKHVAILGLGSIGSVAALELTRAGVGEFTLIDPDHVQIHNLCRHACDLSELGMDKVTAVARRIHRIMPSAKINTYTFDTNAAPDKTMEILEKTDVILVATDTDNSRRLANWIAHKHQIPIIIAGLLERAAGGRVWRIIPGKTACYNCYPSDQETAPASVAYSKAASPRDLTIQPGLGNNIAFITHLAVLYVIETLKEPQAEKLASIPNMVFWFINPDQRWKADALSLYHVSEIPSRLDCSVCHAT